MKALMNFEVEVVCIDCIRERGNNMKWVNNVLPAGSQAAWGMG